MQNLVPRDPIVRDLAMLTIAKLAILIIIYIAFFANYDGRPIDTASHLLGPANAITTN
jgi:hypothetical protein